MTARRFDVVILGGGFAGSALATVLARVGRSTLLIEEHRHPRFAVGESSTPIANLILRDLSNRYGVPEFGSLSRYGSWIKHHPQLRRGLKRGFSYFHHRKGEAFAPRADHHNELLVAASSADRLGDTQWLRSDVDQYLFQLAANYGAVTMEEARIEQVEPSAHRWAITIETGDAAETVEADFLVDATGSANALKTALGLTDQTSLMQTNSRAIFSHFRRVPLWEKWLERAGAATSDHPFACDHSALHQMLDKAWMWALRFDHGVVSVGLVLDALRWPHEAGLPIEREWSDWLRRYPSISDWLSEATIVDPPGRLIRTSRLQRRTSAAAGANWALTPHAAGFVDPLHSAGIAFSLGGVERLADLLDRGWDSPKMPGMLRAYEQMTFRELELIDLLVHGCYLGMGHVRTMNAFSMLYFAAATTYEQRRLERSSPWEAMLRADDEGFVGLVRQAHQRLADSGQVSTPATGHTRAETDPESRADDRDARFEQWLAQAIQPYNIAGLCDPAAHNMYRRTAAE